MEMDTGVLQNWLSIEVVEDESAEDLERRIQKEFDEQYNKAEYNNWRKFDRHRGYSKARPAEDRDECDTAEPLMEEATDDRIFRRDEIKRQQQWDYEDCCDRIRKALKPDYAEMIIAIHLDGMSPSEYAALLGEKPNTLRHRLQRAEKKFKEIFTKTSF